MKPQRLVVFPPRHNGAVGYYALRFHDAGSGRAWLNRVLSLITCLDIDAGERKGDGPQVQFGLTFKGLALLELPEPFLRTLARMSPAFAGGAALRAPYLGDSGTSAPSHWEPAFRPSHPWPDLKEAVPVHALLHVFATDQPSLDRILGDLKKTFPDPDEGRYPEPSKASKPIPRVPPEFLPLATDPSPIQRIQKGGDDYVHFGYRDGLTRVVLDGVGDRAQSAPAGASAVEAQVHNRGEFLLGHVNNGGANPWSLATAPEQMRRFFRDASFGVLRKIAQDVALFEDFVTSAAKRLQAARFNSPVSREYVKAKLCGRWPDGRAFDAGGEGPSGSYNIDFSNDSRGLACPFSAHIRRMNPRRDGNAGAPSPEAAVVHLRSRPLMRRGLPYGPEFDPNAAKKAADKDKAVAQPERGLMGLFFCASLEDQFESVMASWVERLPLGYPGPSDAKDPLAGNHLEGPGFPFPLDNATTVTLPMPAFLQTKGMVYALYLGKEGLTLLARNNWEGEDLGDEY